MQFEKVLGYIASAREEGGTFLTGGTPTGSGYFIEPAIVIGLADDARLVREEQFGPVLPIQVYDDLDDAITRANTSEYGLGGTIWTGDVRRGIAVAGRIETGTIWVNQHMALPLDVPFGGAKESGIGLQNGIEGMKDFTQLRILNAKLAG
jgi:acyl-CoA reductase-like NAD-dependent aldehyde dehydrogenase